MSNLSQTPVPFSDDGATTGQRGIIASVRAFMRDNANVNALLDGEETSDTLVELCAELALDDFNVTPPLIGNYTLDTHPSKGLLMLGTVIWVLQSAGILQSRNQLDYAAGGVTVGSSNKTPLYQSWINAFLQVYETKKANLKKAINAEEAFGSISSEYAQTSFGANLSYFGGADVSVIRDGSYI